MKSDLDSLMAQKNLDALLVFGNAEHNPPMTYLTGGGSLPGESLPTFVLSLDLPKPDKFLAKLRQQQDPILFEIRKNILL